jgi:hypothetical protein
MGQRHNGVDKKFEETKINFKENLKSSVRKDGNTFSVTLFLLDDGKLYAQGFNKRGKLSYCGRDHIINPSNAFHITSDVISIDVEENEFIIKKKNLPPYYIKAN